MKYKLFAIPYAGASATIYYRWKQYLPQSVELLPVELAGRSRRLGEPFYENLEAAAADTLAFIKENTSSNTSYSLFGHSMGSWIAFETAKLILRSPLPPPSRLFFSGNYPPHFAKGAGGIHRLPENEFQREIMQMGATPSIIFENEDLCKVFSPIIRADYKIIENYRHPADEMFEFPCGVNILCGRQDVIKAEEAREWQRYAGQDFTLSFFNGGHFFINEAPEVVVNYITTALSGPRQGG